MKLRYRWVGAVLIFIGFLTMSAAMGQEGEGGMQGNVNGVKNYCLGRHLIGFPKAAVVDARFKVGGASVQTIRGVTDQEFHGILASRENELAERPHRKMESMLIGREEFSEDRVLITSWVSPSSIRMQYMELYSFFPEAGVVQVTSGQSDDEYRRENVEYTVKLANGIRVRRNGEIPAQAGFCIDDGIVLGSELNQEEAAATIRIVGLPGVTLSYISYVTGEPEKSLLRRVSGIPPGYEGTSAGMKSLRRGDRNIGPIKGQELLVRGDANGKRSYEFLWESQGEEDSIEHPFLSLRMTTTDETGKHGEIMDAPFESDAQALALWDSILNTLRLRPGAISTGGADLR